MGKILEKMFKLFIGVFTILFSSVISSSPLINITFKLWVIFTVSTDTNCNHIDILKENLC